MQTFQFQPSTWTIESAGSPQLIDADVLRSRFKGKWGVQKHANSETNMGGSRGYHTILQNGNLLLQANSWAWAVELTRPQTLTLSGDPADVPTGTLVNWRQLPIIDNRPNQSGTRLLGLLEDPDGTLYISSRANYPVSGIDYPTQAAEDSLGQYGHYGVNGIHHNEVGGAIGRNPGDLPGTYLVAMANSSGATHYGPLLYAVTFDKSLPQGGYLDGVKILEYHQANQAVGFTRVSFVRGVAWIEQPDCEGVLFCMTTSTGVVWYGDPVWTDPDTGITYTDPSVKTKGYHSSEYEQQIWVYDPAELRSVLSGAMLPHEPQPKHVIPLTEYEVRNKRSGYVSMCYHNGRLTVSLQANFRPPSQTTSYQPTILEFEF